MEFSPYYNKYEQNFNKFLKFIVLISQMKNYTILSHISNFVNTFQRDFLAAKSQNFTDQ
jgi:hypothetical protein